MILSINVNRVAIICPFKCADMGRHGLSHILTSVSRLTLYLKFYSEKCAKFKLDTNTRSYVVDRFLVRYT